MRNRAVRILSWNVLVETGAKTQDIMSLADAHNANILALQEVTPRITEELDPAIWYTHYAGFPDRNQGTAVAFRKKETKEIPQVWSLDLPFKRSVAIGLCDNIMIASVHLSLNQIANRWQLRKIRQSLEQIKAKDGKDGFFVICGDTNIAGPCPLKNMTYLGPKEPTHFTWNLLPVNLDRFYISKQNQSLSTQALDFGKSDHKPILLTGSFFEEH